jgi:hypothetical protein
MFVSSLTLVAGVSLSPYLSLFGKSPNNELHMAEKAAFRKSPLERGLPSCAIDE